MVEVDLWINNDLINEDYNKKIVKLEDWAVINVINNKSFSDYLMELIMCFFKSLIFWLTPLLLFILFVGIIWSNITSYFSDTITNIQ